MKNYRAFDYAKNGFRLNDKLYFGFIAFVLYTIGFVKFHIKRSLK